ncbi:MAG: dienelactone hydrolase family protein [Ilumatobacteraceae bacterium]
MALDDYLAAEIALDCADGLFSRREAVRRLMLLGLTAPAAAGLLASCGSDDDVAGQSPSGQVGDAASTDPSTPATDAAGVVAEEIRFAGPRGELIGVLSAAPSARGAVLVVHENRGLTAHIRSIPPRLASDGYTALAIDLLSEEGGTAALPSEGDATAALGNAPAERLIEDLRAGLDELERRVPSVQLATIGFCFGGGMTWQLLAAGDSRLSAAVPFYGPAPADADFRGSPNAAVLAIYAELDARVNASQDAARNALEAAGLVHEIRVFPGVDHAFFNDTGQRYDADAATEAYAAMLAWFEQHLAG